MIGNRIICRTAAPGAMFHDTKDIEKVMQGKEFENLNDTQKEPVIAELHKHWSDPNSEIVKRMNSFTEKPPEILKPILES
jgi:hypothetical protein